MGGILSSDTGFRLKKTYSYLDDRIDDVLFGRTIFVCGIRVAQPPSPRLEVKVTGNVSR